MPIRTRAMVKAQPAYISPPMPEPSPIKPAPPLSKTGKGRKRARPDETEDLATQFQLIAPPLPPLPSNSLMPPPPAPETKPKKQPKSRATKPGSVKFPIPSPAPSTTSSRSSRLKSKVKKSPEVIVLSDDDDHMDSDSQESVSVRSTSIASSAPSEASSTRSLRPRGPNSKVVKNQGHYMPDPPRRGHPLGVKINPKVLASECRLVGQTTKCALQQWNQHAKEIKIKAASIFSSMDAAFQEILEKKRQEKAEKLAKAAAAAEESKGTSDNDIRTSSSVVPRGKSSVKVVDTTYVAKSSVKVVDTTYVAKSSCSFSPLVGKTSATKAADATFVSKTGGTSSTRTTRSLKSSDGGSLPLFSSAESKPIHEDEDVVAEGDEAQEHDKENEPHDVFEDSIENENEEENAVDDVVVEDEPKKQEEIGSTEEPEDDKEEAKSTEDVFENSIIMLDADVNMKEAEEEVATATVTHSNISTSTFSSTSTYAPDDTYLPNCTFVKPPKEVKKPQPSLNETVALSKPKVEKHVPKFFDFNQSHHAPLLDVVEEEEDAVSPEMFPSASKLPSVVPKPGGIKKKEESEKEGNLSSSSSSSNSSFKSALSQPYGMKAQAPNTVKLDLIKKKAADAVRNKEENLKKKQEIQKKKNEEWKLKAEKIKAAEKEKEQKKVLVVASSTTTEKQAVKPVPVKPPKALVPGGQTHSSATGNPFGLQRIMEQVPVLFKPSGPMKGYIKQTHVSKPLAASASHCGPYTEFKNKTPGKPLSMMETPHVFRTPIPMNESLLDTTADSSGVLNSYDITRYEDLDDDLKHRENKPVPAWASNKQEVASMLFKQLYVREFPIGSNFPFPKVQKGYRLFSN